MKIPLLLFYFLLLLLPTQLGRHFFFDFSQVAGVRSDYLAPTVYLTDVVILLLIVAWVREELRRQKLKLRIKIKKTYTFLFFVFCFLFFTSMFVAANRWAALYKLVKIAEFFLLGFVITKIRPNLFTVLAILTVDVVYSSLIGIWQFILQRSIGGLFWFFGERTFSAGTPGIANFSFFGRLFLRPYATFPHPNVLGGFLATTLPLFFFVLVYNRQQKSKILFFWFFLCFMIGLTTLFLSFSRASYLVAAFGLVLVASGSVKSLIFWFKRKSSLFLIIFYSLIIFSAVVPVALYRNLSFDNQSWHERVDLINATIAFVAKAPFLGLGLNNFIVHMRQFIATTQSIYIFQPVHNIYLLLLAETGVIGFFLIFTFLLGIYRRSLSTSPLVVLALTQLFLLGLFDHYLFTLQQGQLLFTLFASLAISKARDLAFFRQST